ncbi:hypothetical protein FEK30_04230 [Picosynechococcus sp. PCC 11901]|uniref:hypothetical protein n=1 Tax=Picosynechococcus sp. PCC 11901 TaxID=2579791 RepID=UPI0010FBCB93|nr:hypothetical protein [Picosynechococcus sp. PCC 11901]QCS48705.1 hypothetical protein FEK30_04230 [Picosynechococcus sp. PCC 11901]
MELPSQGNDTIAEASVAPEVRVQETPQVEAPTTEASQEAPTPVASAPAPNVNDPTDVIVAAIQAASREAVLAQTVEVGAFAENYLLKPGNRSNRRRPGANMAAFKAMAQNIKF